MEDTKKGLRWPDYIVVSLTLAVSIGIGVFYAIRQKSTTTEDYLMANRKLHVIPAAISMLISFLSAITLLGDSAEIYFYGITWQLYCVTATVAIIIVCVFFIPLLHPLRITSINDYVSRRYRSHGIRVLGALMQIVQASLLCGIYILGPSLMIQAMSGFPVWVSILVIGIASTAYSTIGGFRGVVFTDVFQTVVIAIGLSVIVVQGIIETGGISKVWRLMYEGDRMNIKLDLNPLNRTDLGSMLFIYVFHRVSMYGVQQMSVQRFCAMKTLNQARMAILMVIPIMWIVACVSGLSGVVTYTYYASVGCDPFKAGYIKNKNQILPYFVMDVVKTPGIAGLFTATILCGSLSSLSSSYNSVSALFWEDILKQRKFFSKLKQRSRTFVTKAIVFSFGIVTTTIGLLLMNVEGSMIKITYTVVGPIFSSTFLIVVLGATFPWINGKSAVGGAVIGFSAAYWVSLAAQIHGLKHEALQTSTANCSLQQSLNETTTFVWYTQDTFSTAHTSTLIPDVPQRERSGLLALYSMSHLWYTFFGDAVGTIAALLLSLLPGFSQQCQDVDQDCLFPFVRKLIWRSGKVQRREYHDVPLDDIKKDEI